MERRIKSLVRWNALAMVMRANKVEEGIGGHISTYASAATLYEVGFNHFFRAHAGGRPRSGLLPGSRLARNLCARFSGRPHLAGAAGEFPPRIEARRGLSSYPHPWLMPDFWEFPTVSMGLGPIQAIYQARFNRYLENRGLEEIDQRQGLGLPGRRRDATSPSRWAPSRWPRAKSSTTSSSSSTATCSGWTARCAATARSFRNWRPIFRGAGWNVIKVIWGGDWDPLIAKDRDGLLVKRMGEITDGQYQKYFVASGAYFRQNFFGTDPRLLKMVEHLSDEQLAKMRLGGHDPIKVYAAYKRRGRAPGLADGDSGQDDQGLRPGRERRRQKHHPPAEEDQRRGADEVPLALRHSHSPTKNCTMRLSIARRDDSAEDSVPAASGARSWAAICRSARCARPS